MEFESPFRAILTPLGLDLYDVEFAGGTLNVTVTNVTGVDVEALTTASSAISVWLDEHDPIAQRYTLDVSSPGLERKLRTPAHFQSAVGETITLRELREDQPTRRLEGELVSVTGDGVTIRDVDAGEVTVRFDHLERARTVFAWGATAKPSPSRGGVATKGRR